ncbi:LamG domain-containing protein, partial [bacterium]|nr:LamG domain-containing protein [bacterium]
GAGKVGWEVDSDAIDVGVSSTATVHDGNWHHIVGTWAAASGAAVAPSQFKIYIDGALATVTTGTTSSATSPLTGFDTARIGHHAAWGTYLSGTIDEVAVYHTELSASRVLAHYQARLATACYSTTALANGTWALLTGVFSSAGPTLQFYVNGSLECTITNSGAAYTGSVNPLAIGAAVVAPNTPTAGTYWKGSVGDARTYTNALSAGAVGTNYSATSSRFP